MKKLLLLFLFNAALIANGQWWHSQWYVGVSVDDTLGFGATTHQTLGNCYPGPEYVDCLQLDSVTGIAYYYIITDVTPANALFIGSTLKQLKVGDTLNPKYCQTFYFSQAGHYGYITKAVGIPQIAGELYGCDTLMGVDDLGICPDQKSFGFRTKCAVLISNSIQNIAINDFSILPNPVTSSSIIQLNRQLYDAELAINNILGREVLKRKFTGNRITIDKGNLESGVYFVTIRDSENTYIKKIIIQ